MSPFAGPTEAPYIVTATTIEISNYLAGDFDDEQPVAVRLSGAGYEALIGRERIDARLSIFRRQGERRAADVAHLLRSIRRRTAWTLGCQTCGP